MRIVGGTLSGRTFLPPTSITTRPMMDRVRQALFNILAHREWGKYIGDLFEGECQVLDAFAGTGALAFEALSRGATLATLFDKDLDALKVARSNALKLGLNERCSILSADAMHPPRAVASSKLIFLAPPYRKNLISPAFEALDAAGWIKDHAVIVAETAKKEALPALASLELLDTRTYGDTALHFLAR